MYPWRKIRTARESYLDNTKTPYTEGHNINEFIAAKKQKKPWQKVIPKDKDNRFNPIHWNPYYESDPAEAKKFSKTQMDKFEKSLLERGPSRETKPYEPPANVSESILAIVDKDQDLSDTKIKFEVISRCVELFKHDLPSSYLNEIETVADLINYFSQPIRGVNSYTSMARTQDKLLPNNLYLIQESLRYNRDDDSYFKGYNALPGIISKVDGLRAAKKYPILNQDEFQWPDI